MSSFSIEGGISPFFTRSSLFFQRFACFHYYLLLIVPCFEVLYFVVCKSELVSYFSESITLIYHTDDFCFIFTYMSIFSAHKNDLLWYLYSTIGGLFFLLSTFYGAVHVIPLLHVPNQNSVIDPVTSQSQLYSMV